MPPAIHGPSERSFPASPKTASVVRRYAERRAFLREETAIALPPRPDLFIEFYLRDPFLIRDDDDDPRSVGSDAIIVAPHANRLVTAHLIGDIHYFSIQLQPTALHRLVGVAMPQLADRNVDAMDLLGSKLHPLRDAILRASSFGARVAAAERWFEDRLAATRPADTVDVAARLMRRMAGNLPLHRLAMRTELSERHWRRRFTEQTGLAPKLYARIARLDAAIERRRSHPDMSWADVAYAGGYADQSHMLRDFRDLLGTTPATWLADPELGSKTIPDFLAERGPSCA